MMRRLDVGEIMIIGSIVVQHEAVTLVAQYQSQGLCERRGEDVGAEPLTT
jgi:hypothetical protein